MDGMEDSFRALFPGLYQDALALYDEEEDAALAALLAFSRAYAAAMRGSA